MPGAQHRMSDKYCRRFGQIAVESGYISEAQAREALCRQIDEDLAGKTHRLLGTILFDLEWMNSGQIEAVLDRLLEEMRGARAAQE